MLKKIVLIISIFLFLITISNCGISKIKLSKSDVEEIDCENFYLVGQNYKTLHTKADIIEKWNSKGFSIHDTTIYTKNQKWLLYKTYILNPNDTTRFIGFQIFENSNIRKIYLHGFCLINEKTPKKSQKDLEKIQKEIEIQFLKTIAIY